MNYASEMASGGMIYKQRFMRISSGFQVMLRLLPQKSELVVLVVLMRGIKVRLAFLNLWSAMMGQVVRKQT
jgi:hypothetical protein